MDALDKEFRELLCSGKMTIGQIIRKRRSCIDYRNLGYRKVGSATLATAFETLGRAHFIRRSRMMYHNKRPVIFIHEFLPL
jgi:chorismate-pyruvate lyase